MPQAVHPIVIGRLWWCVIRDIWDKFRLGVLGLIGLMIVNGLMEGIAVALLVPLLNMIGVGSPTQSPLLQVFRAVFAAVSVPFNLYSVLFLVLAVNAIQAVVYVAQAWLSSHLQDSYMAWWRQALFSRCMGANWAFFVKKRGGELVNAIISEPDRLGGAFHYSNQMMAISIVTAVYLALSLYVSWQVTVLVLLIGALLFFVTYQPVLGSYNTGAEISEYRSALHSACQEFIAGAKLIKATSTEGLAEQRFGEFNDSLKRSHFKGTFQPNVLKAAFEFASMAVLCLVLVVGTQQLGVSSTELLVILAIFVRLAPRMFSLQQNVQLLSLYLPSIRRVSDLLDEAKQFQEPRLSSHEHAPIFQGGVSIDIDSLSFSYEDRLVLDHVTMNIPRGKTIGIVGGSGAGKSTLVDCLLRLNEPPEGSIRIQGLSLQQYDVDIWRRCIGYLAQETFLFHDTIRNNILWGASQCDEESMVEASKRAGIHEFVQGLDRGYDTVVGDRGVRLSGGQKQRVGLARALTNQPSLLILDEPTSALDSASEEYVLEAIMSLRGEMTIVLITHRLSTVRNADEIYVLESGRVVEYGSWSKLVANERRFSELLRLQQGVR